MPWFHRTVSSLMSISPRMLYLNQRIIWQVDVIFSVLARHMERIHRLMVVLSFGALIWCFQVVRSRVVRIPYKVMPGEGAMDVWRMIWCGCIYPMNDLHTWYRLSTALLLLLKPRLSGSAYSLCAWHRHWQNTHEPICEGYVISSRLWKVPWF